MYFDSKRNAYIDRDTGAVIFQEEPEDNTEIPTLPPETTAAFRAGNGGYVVRNTTSPPVISSMSHELDGYRSMSLRSSSVEYNPSGIVDRTMILRTPSVTSASIDRSNSTTLRIGSGDQYIPLERTLTTRSPEPVSPTVDRSQYLRSHSVDPSSLERGITLRNSPGVNRSGSVDMEEELFELRRQGSLEVAEPTMDQTADPQGWEDWNLARSLQVFEFELMDDTGGEHDPAADGDFHQKEYRASRSCRRQLCTPSFAICLLQIGVLIAMIQIDGFTSSSSNATIGPPVYSLVRFGAKETGLIVLRKQWWRIISPTMLHAGILHIVPNVAIQLRIGGYLNLVYGNVKFLWIYFFGGVFGVLMSCCFLPDSVGVGSSGALMGMLASWVVWILFRWNKIPKEHHRIRNCQLLVVLASIAVTMATSAMPNVDWAAHAGGAFQGALWGIILLSNELEPSYTTIVMKLIALLISLVTSALAVYYLLFVIHASSSNFYYWDANDDWH